jgi:hypothetical protein
VQAAACVRKRGLMTSTPAPLLDGLASFHPCAMEAQPLPACSLRPAAECHSRAATPAAGQGSAAPPAPPRRRAQAGPLGHGARARQAARAAVRAAARPRGSSGPAEFRVAGRRSLSLLLAVPRAPQAGRGRLSAARQAHPSGGLAVGAAAAAPGRGAPPVAGRRCRAMRRAAGAAVLAAAAGRSTAIAQRLPRRGTTRPWRCGLRCAFRPGRRAPATAGGGLVVGSHLPTRKPERLWRQWQWQTTEPRHRSHRAPQRPGQVAARRLDERDDGTAVARNRRRGAGHWAGARAPAARLRREAYYRGATSSNKNAGAPVVAAGTKGNCACRALAQGSAEARASGAE